MSITFGKRIRNYRRSKGWSQEELANKIGVTKEDINNREIGENTPDVEYIELMSKVFGVSIEDLLTKNPKVRNIYSMDENGIYIKDDEDEIIINPGNFSFIYHKNQDDAVNRNKFSSYFSERYFNNHKTRIISGMIYSVGLFIVLIIYLILGFVFEENYFGWITFWPLFFLLSVVESVYASIAKKSLIFFNITFLVLFIYLFTGLYTGIWHPTWIILFAIPAYYSLVWPIEMLYLKNIKNY